MAFVTSTVIAVSAAIAATAAVSGAAVSAYGLYQQGQAQKKIAEYNAQVQQNNALMKGQQAKYESGLIQQRNNRLRGAQAAAASKSGISLDGSVNDVMYDSSLQGDLNSLSAIYKGQVGSEESTSGANISIAQGKSAQSQSDFGAGGSLIGGLGQAAGYYGASKYNQNGGYPVF